MQRIGNQKNERESSRFNRQMLFNIRNPNKFPVLNAVVIISKYSRICEELPERKINFDYDRYSSLDSE